MRMTTFPLSSPSRRMSMTYAALCVAGFGLAANGGSSAAEPDIQNYGHDPFLHISSAVPDCPVPLGPAMRRAEWIADAHHRAEKGNSCWLEGRCRLPNSYAYDTEIAASAQRRLDSLSGTMPWRTSTSLWLTFQRRIVVVQGCVAPGFPTAALIRSLGQTADVENVVNQTVVRPGRAPLPYPTVERPDPVVLRAPSH
ncbi:hypothetical protein PTE30175_00933 [Pandoraea terrae]|uniref:BON domain-containing protein n=1 Tax=Pandoraea terrae TaxID=1537710 RepID=A0A5E4SVK3_9BURK|nr:hypothetical protein [Pandoraea terrae]VVD78448.1 hypothetical protein PTE30175_00933 [Pandoraea terrae]